MAADFDMFKHLAVVSRPLGHYLVDPYGVHGQITSVHQARKENGPDVVDGYLEILHPDKTAEPEYTFAFQQMHEHTEQIDGRYVAFMVEFNPPMNVPQLDDAV